MSYNPSDQTIEVTLSTEYLPTAKRRGRFELPDDNDRTERQVETNNSVSITIELQ